MLKQIYSSDPPLQLQRQLLVAGAACIVLFMAPVGLADQSDNAKSPDANVLEDLGANLFDDTPSQANAVEQGVPARLSAQHDDEGEDVGEPRSTGQDGGLKSVQRRMKSAASLLASQDASGEASTTQQEVVNELDAMIAKLQKQCESCGGQCSKPPGPSSKPPKPGKSGSKPGEAPGTAAMQTMAPTDRSAIGNLVKDLWGRLPERQREELLQPLSEEFLPEYAAEIEEYFRVLAESPGDRAAERQP
jgi:hypothetical protein